MKGAPDIDVQTSEKIEDVSSIYRHHPLSANTIRVLRILPATNLDHSDTISCSLSVISLDPSPPEYRALSYVWGDPSVTRVILIDDQKFEVRINLWNYLHQARKEGYSDPLWVDAVCIDQTNLAERIAQVAIMGQIYSKAFEVRAWLGTGTKRNLQAMKYIAEVNWQKEAEQPRNHYNRSLDREQVRSICEVLNLEYWSRLWITQAYILASSVAVQCGPNIVPGTTLGYFIQEPLVVCFYKAHKQGPVLAFRLIRARRDRIRSKSMPVGYELAVLLGRSLEHASSTSKCTDLHDNVYALLSLDKIASKEIVPDYTKSLSQLFLEVIHLFKTNVIKDGIPILAYCHFVYIAVPGLKARWQLSDCTEACQAWQDLEEYIDRLQEGNLYLERYEICPNHIPGRELRPVHS